MKELTVAKRAAREAGKLVLSYLGNLKEVGYKSERDPVTEADKASEALIAGIIREAFPTHGFVSEEATAWEGDGLWVVDPLDGTVNFSHGYPMFCVSVALVRHGETVVGAVYEPLRREMFSAAKGKGAFLNGRPIHVSGQAYMKKALLATGFPYDIDSRAERVVGLFGKMALASKGMRRGGAAALDLCYLACGRVDAFWELGLKRWDTAAAMLIVTEAGGKFSDFKGGRYEPGMDETAASNTLLHDRLVELLGES